MRQVPLQRSWWARLPRPEARLRQALCMRKAVSRYTVEISWSDEADRGPDATKAKWEVEVVGVGSGPKVQMVHVALHAPDALGIAKGLARFYHALRRRLRAATDIGLVALTPGHVSAWRAYEEGSRLASSYR